MDLAQAIVSALEVACLIGFFSYLKKFEKMIGGIEHNIFLMTQQQARIEEELKQIRSNESRGE